MNRINCHWIQMMMGHFLFSAILYPNRMQKMMIDSKIQHINVTFCFKGCKFLELVNFGVRVVSARFDGSPLEVNPYS